MYKKLSILVLVILIFAAGWYFLSPLFLDQEVDEDFPMADITAAERDEMADAVADLDVKVPSTEAMREMTAEEITELEREVVMESEKQPDTEVEDAMPPAESVDNEPRLFYFGEFEDADSFHKGSGTANIYQLPDTSWILRLEDFEVTNGPDLRVLLSSNSNPTDSESLGDYVELGKLKGNIGNQNYEIPDSVDVSVYNSVVIYCKPFHVVFSIAELN